MSFLRWVTLKTATQINPSVVLVTRSDPVRPVVNWKEKQDFQESDPKRDWMPEVNKLPITRIELSDIAPEIADLRAPDIQTADLLAWWILANEGGTVADMDIVFLRPLPQIRQNVEVVVFSGHPKAGYVPVSIMQGNPCKIWEDAYQRALGIYQPNSYESCGSKCLDPTPIAGLDERIIFPWAGKHPWSNWHAWLFKTDDYPKIPLSCAGIHWYAGHNQKWNQKINDPKDLKCGAIAWAVKSAIDEYKTLL